jgi:hypothetical protein
MMNTTLYLTPDNARYFLAPDDKSLPVGDFEVRPKPYPMPCVGGPLGVGGKARRL